MCGELAQPATGIERPLVRLMRPDDLGVAIGLASAAFRENRFYQAAMGFDPARFDAYWRCFLSLAAGDPGARIFVLEIEGRVAGLLVAGFGTFPSARRALVFLVRLLAGIGPARFVRYLAFTRRYAALMRRPRAEHALEARGLWLLVAPGLRRAGLGLLLLRSAISTLRGEGKTLFTGLLDAGDGRLVDFYRRAGFRVGPRIPMGGGTAAVFEQRVGPEGGSVS
jgi:GNAT superfamily N-acetyltransferase